MFVTIDLDKVLIQNTFMLGVFPTVHRILRPYIKPEMLEGQESDHWIVDRIYDEHARRLRAKDWVPSSDWHAIINYVARALGYTETIDIASIVRQHAQKPYIAVYRDARPALEWLKQEANSLWWISNAFTEYQLPVLDALDLSRYFNGYFGPDTHGGVKPFAPLFQAAARAAGEHPSRGVHVGDYLTNDVSGANLNGMRSVWLDRSLNPVFDGVAPWDIPKMDTFITYMRGVARKEFAYDAYELDIAKYCIPDAVISSLDQLPEVLTYLRALRHLD